MFNKAKLFIFFSLLIFDAYGQSFLKLSSNNDKNLAAGIENNYFAAVSFKPVPKLNIVFLNSIYVEDLKYQKFSFDINYLLLQKKRVEFYASLNSFGNYNKGIEKLYLSPELEIQILNAMRIAGYADISYIERKFIVNKKVGFLVTIKSGLDFFMEYGNPYIGSEDENVFNSGLYFLDKSIKIKAFAQVPETINLKYTRFLISFLYVIY